MPRSLIWNSDRSRQYPGIANFALQRRLAVMAAHDSMLAARVKQTRFANRKRQPVPFAQDDLVYLSTKNIKFEKGLARKLIPKYIGPYRILRDFGNSSFQLELPANLKQRGVHDVFHASLLRIHIPNDDRRFPGRLESQLGITTENTTNEWAVNKITNHYGRRSEALFEVLWTSGDTTWMPYSQAVHLNALNEYFEVLGISDIRDLGYGSGSPPISDAQIFAGAIRLGFSRNDTHIMCTPHGHRAHSPVPCPRMSTHSKIARENSPPRAGYFDDVNVRFTGVLDRRGFDFATIARPSDGRLASISPAQVGIFVDWAVKLSECLEKGKPAPNLLNPLGYSLFIECMNAISERTTIGFPRLSESSSGHIYPAPNGTRPPTRHDFLVEVDDLQEQPLVREGWTQVSEGDLRLIEWAEGKIRQKSEYQLRIIHNNRPRDGRQNDEGSRKERQREKRREKRQRKKQERSPSGSESESDAPHPTPSRKKSRHHSTSPERRAGPSTKKYNTNPGPGVSGAKTAKPFFQYTELGAARSPLWSATPIPVAAPIPTAAPAPVATAVPAPAPVKAADASTPDVTMTPVLPHWTEGVFEPAQAKFAQDLERERDAEGEIDTTITNNSGYAAPA
uniref:Tf2-1-like SH3-like domain-containing protein n=1 Tax=Mycena chlorophos TaxID=658473 RepID=A0ABQ0M4S4_MYCCL|nr:predicted protein [Mycena chlorophos]